MYVCLVPPAACVNVFLDILQHLSRAFTRSQPQVSPLPPRSPPQFIFLSART
jgi:hypothetical protein